jgi:hypothetical protein
MWNDSNMKRVIIIIALGAFLVSGSAALAVEKKSGPKPSPKKVEDSAALKSGKSARKASPEPRKQEQAGQKDFDDFIDRNNNGIDDRVEQPKEKTAPEKPRDTTKQDSPPEEK